MTTALPDKNNAVVLLVEDSDDDIFLFERAYQQAGIRNPLHIVHNGDDALAYLQGRGEFADRAAHPFPVLMLLDLRMPGKSGFDVLQAVRADPATKELHVLVVTNSDGVQIVQQAYDLGANSFILKSVTTSDFAGQLREIQEHWL